MEEARVDVPEGFDFETYINNYEGILYTIVIHQIYSRKLYRIFSYQQKFIYR